MDSTNSTIQQLATRMIPEKIRWGILLAVFVLQSVTAALLSAYSAIGTDSPAWLAFAAAFLLAISAPVTLLAAVNVTKTTTAPTGEADTQTQAEEAPVGDIDDQTGALTDSE